MKKYHLFVWMSYERGCDDYDKSFETLEDVIGYFNASLINHYDNAEIYESQNDGTLKSVADYGTWNSAPEWRIKKTITR